MRNQKPSLTLRSRQKPSLTLRSRHKSEALREAKVWLRGLHRREILALAAELSGGLERAREVKPDSPSISRPPYRRALTAISLTHHRTSGPRLCWPGIRIDCRRFRRGPNDGTNDRRSILVPAFLQFSCTHCPYQPNTTTCERQRDELADCIPGVTTAFHPMVKIGILLNIRKRLSRTG